MPADRPRKKWPDCRGIGGRFAVEWVAGLAWNQWPVCRGIGGRFRVELVATLPWNTPGVQKPAGSTANHRNGSSGKTVLTDDGPLRIEVPRDRHGAFEPQIVGKHERRFTGFDDKIIALYARGLTVREVQAHLQEMYTIEVSPDLISSVTDAVMSEVVAWQSRPLEPMYPVVFFDALRVKIREEGVVRNKAVYLALGVLPDGTRDILGLWIEAAACPRTVCPYPTIRFSSRQPRLPPRPVQRPLSFRN